MPTGSLPEFAVSAVVLAAGASRRMGQPKMLLPWGDSIVIRKVVSTLIEGGVARPVIVTGRCAEDVLAALAGIDVTAAHNPDFAVTEMLISLQIGLAAVDERYEAILVALGDQPQIEAHVVQTILSEAHTSTAPIILPSYQMKRGHPWLLRKSLWQEIRELPASANLRQFLNAHASEIQYVNVDTSSVLMDLDTPDDYEKQKPR